MLCSLLLVAQLRGATVAWYEAPTATELHPVRYSAWGRYHELYASKTEGLGASPVFREPMSSSAVYYTLWSLTGEQPVLLSDDTGDYWRDMAISSSSIAAEALMWETIYRSEELGEAVRFMRTFVSPNLELKRGPDGWKAKANDPDVRLRPQLARKELQEGMFGPPAGRPPTLTMGSGLEVEDLDQLTEAKRSVDAATWVRFQRFGLDQITIRGLLLSRSWELSARQHVVRGLSWALAMSSKSSDPLPRDWGTGLTWTIPHLSWFTVMIRYRQDWPYPDAEDVEWNARITVRWLPPARAPFGPDRWPIGRRSGSEEPSRPMLARGAPIETALPVRDANESSGEPR